MNRPRNAVFVTLLVLSAATAPALPRREAAVPSLAAVYKPFFPIGAAVEPRDLTAVGELLAAQASSLVAENAMKWQLIHPHEGNDAAAYNFSSADAIVAFAKEHGMRVRGHTLVWHQQVPAVVFRNDTGDATRAEVLARLKDHITTVLTHFKGSVYAWDVVNEAISDSGDGWRTDSPWYRTAGADLDKDGIPDYITRAFEFARAADPGARLFYNDFNIESGAKLEKAYDLVKALKQKKLIDGVGIQGHWSIYSADPGAVSAAIDRFASLGVEVQITELDLSIYRWGDRSSIPDLTKELAARQADAYGALFKVFRQAASQGKLTGVTLWGVTDEQTWLDTFPVTGRKDRPLLFGVDHRPKAAFWSVAKW